MLPAFGSDHRPYLAVLCRDPAAAAHQPPPKLLPDDMQTAQALIQKGMGKAEKTGYKGHHGPGADSG